MTSENKKQLFALVPLILYLVIGFSVMVSSSDLYPWPTNWSFSGLASWSQPLLASGTSNPATASGAAGDIFVNIATAAYPSIWRHSGAAWVQIAGGGSTGVATHSDLTNLSFSTSGHSGFASETAVNDHIADYADPHGATMTVSGGITVGSGTTSAYIEETATGVLTIASYAAFLPCAASPSVTVGTGTFWIDDSGKIYLYRNGAWATTANASDGTAGICQTVTIGSVTMIFKDGLISSYTLAP